MRLFPSPKNRIMRGPCVSGGPPVSREFGELVILQRFLTATGIIYALSQLILHAILQHLNQYTFPQPQIHFCNN